MDHDEILNVGIFADNHFFQLRPNNGVRPEGRTFVDIHLAIDKGRRMKIGSVIYGDIRTKF